MNTHHKKIEYIINENGCHICTSHCQRNGYPAIGRNGKTLYIGRYLWEQKNGLIPEGLEICHKCDTPACINLEHFFLGTQNQNMKDMVSKNRQVKGEEINGAKLTREQVLQIREEPGTLKEIGERYGVSSSHIKDIKKKRRWAWL